QTSAPGRDRPRLRRRPKQVRDRRPLGLQRPGSDARPRSFATFEEHARSRDAGRPRRSGVPPQFASGRGSALRPSRPSNPRPCLRQAISVGLSVKPAGEAEGWWRDVPPIPRCETALREKSAGYRSNFPSLPTAEKTCLYKPLVSSRPQRPDGASVEKTRNRFRPVDRTIPGAKSNPGTRPGSLPWSNGLGPNDLERDLTS